MKNLILLIVFLILFFTQSTKTSAQMNDDSKYKTVYLEDLCSELELHPDALILDVRSKGEVDDTSSFSNLNIGRLKNSVNIDVNTLESRLGEIESYKDKDIFVYCSHSHRSRVASELLTEKGFKKVHNVNGGLSEFVLDELQCRSSIYSTSLPYKLLSPDKVKQLINTGTSLIIDVRTEKEYNSISEEARKNAGRLKNSINIPAADVEKRLSEIDRNKQVILCDLDCSLTPDAAKLLIKNGYSNVGILIFGLSTWINKTGSGDNNLMEGLPAYKNLSIIESIEKLKKASVNTVFIDTRSSEEFNNKSEEAYKNLGHIKNAINISAADITNRISELSGMKDKEIIVYSNYPPSSDGVCKVLTDNGFKNVSNIFCGIGKLIWAKSNLKGIDFPDELIVK